MRAILKSLAVIASALAFAAAPAGPGHAAIPILVSYQGVLTDDGGNLVPDGNYQLTFRLYTTLSGGSAIFTETQTVAVAKGGFSVLLGSTASLSGLSFDVLYYLGTSVAGGPELVPRVLLASSPYALNSVRLQLPFPGSATSSGSLIGITNLGTGPALQGQSNSAAANSAAIRGILGGSAANGSAGVRGEGTTGNPNTVGVWGSHAGSGTGVFGLSTAGFGVGGTTNGGGAAGVFGYSTVGSSAGVKAQNTNVTGTALEIQQGAIKVTGAGVGTSTPVFIHAVTAANRVQNNATVIDHPLCNNAQDALLFAQPVRDVLTGQEYRQPIMTFWSVVSAPNKWALIGPVGTTIPIGAHFAILVIKP